VPRHWADDYLLLGNQPSNSRIFRVIGLWFDAANCAGVQINLDKTSDAANNGERIRCGTLM
jgi:hypothetical protein